MGAPTENDYKVFDSISNANRFKIIKGYLWLDYNMVEVGNNVFPGEEDRASGEKVSAVMRCYGFGGQNHGAFKQWGIANYVKDSDIKAFINKYPNGCRYDENGTEMFSFLKQTIDRRLESERVKRMREQAAAEEKRRAEAEERRRKQAIEAEERRLQEQLRKEQEDAERRAIEYKRKQDEAKNRALSIVNEAEKLMSQAQNYEELRIGVERYREAFTISWKEPDSFGIMEQECNVQKSDNFLRSCEKLALYEYGKRNYQNVLKYGCYVCDISKIGSSEMLKAQLSMILQKRTGDFHPEATCFALMADAYLCINNVKEALHVAEYGVKAGSIRCMEILGDYYAKSSKKDDILLSCYYFEMMGNISDEAIIKKKKCMQNKVITMRADDVEKVMLEYSPNWLPVPHNSNDTWETYSNLPNHLLNKFERESKNIIHMPNDLSSFDKFGYEPGQIDLRELWEVYKAAYTKIEKKMFIFKKQEYVGELREGDFVECCKYLWEKRYYNKKDENVSHGSQFLVKDDSVEYLLKEDEFLNVDELPEDEFIEVDELPESEYKEFVFEVHKRYSMPPLIRNKHSDNREYYRKNIDENRVSEYENRFYYIDRYDSSIYLCVSNDVGTNIEILAELSDDYFLADIHVNITGIYVYDFADFRKVQIAHYSFEGELLCECKEEYSGGYENGHHIENLCFYDSKAYYLYSNEEKEEKKVYINCMDVDNNKVYTVYEKASEISRLFAIKDKLVFDATYENQKYDDLSDWGWMILDLKTSLIECISNPFCNPENVVDDPEVYNEKSSRYNKNWCYNRNIVSFDFNRNIFWTEKEVMEGEDSSEHVIYREPRSLWGDRNVVIPDMPIWRIMDRDESSEREYFDGVHRYFAPSYSKFKSADINGECYEWGEINSGHGNCQKFRVIGDYLFLDIEASGEEQYGLSIDASEPIRESWFEKGLNGSVVATFNRKKCDATMESSNLENSTANECVGFKVEERKDCRMEKKVMIGDLNVEKIIGNTDIKYNICTFGSKFHIGFGVNVTIEINGKTYECKTHNSAKGRIDGMKKLFTENEIKLGDCIEAHYYQDDNRIILIKK